MRLGIQAICDRGLLRDRNEDALSVNGLFLRDDAVELSVEIPEEGFFYLLVSDGMGGHEKGEEASRFALEEMEEQFSFHHIRPESFEDDVREAARYINFKLNRTATEDGQQRPMGCTLTGVIWHYGRTWLVNAGDSRTYRFRDGLLRQLTTDETERGITGDPDTSKLLLNCLGGGAEGRLAVDDLDGKLLEWDVLLVCSDGLCDMLPDEEIEAALAGGATASDLLRLACEAGGTDNVSIILARVI
ncbi:MAG: protein phosphatase 2C domain-containing protein [Bacteroidales bacterium]|nr:protein phosphatase 2C domain-containing protein [Bacteroidales bacterium]